MPAGPRVGTVSLPEALVAPGKGSARFDRRARLLKPEQYRRVFQNPDRSAARGLLVLARPNDVGYPRLGMAFAKRHLKKAVDRNRLKRLTRESFRTHRDELAPMDFVVMARSQVRDLSNAEILEILSRHWQRLSKRCESR